MTPPDDMTLAAAAQTDPQAFDRLYRRYVTDVYRYCFAQAGSRAEAEDLTAQIFLAALEGLPRYRGRGDFAAWLFAIARRKCADFHRQHYAHPQTALDEDANHPQPQVDFGAGIDDRRDWDCLARALRQISRDRRDAILLRYWGDLSVRDAARALGKTQAAVKMLVSRGIADLKARCSDDKS